MTFLLISNSKILGAYDTEEEARRQAKLGTEDTSTVMVCLVVAKFIRKVELVEVPV
jgi:hypothetical protein